MWKYNDIDELYHYGVLGMKWGHRKSKAYYDAKKAYKKARKADRKANMKLIGNKIVTQHWTKMSEYNPSVAKRHGDLDKLTTKTGINRTFAKANMKRLGNKRTNKYGYNKKEFKTFVKSQASAGLPGSGRDINNSRAGTDLYKKVTRTKGKKYADRVLEKAGNKRGRQIITGALVVTGAKIASDYYRNNY